MTYDELMNAKKIKTNKTAHRFHDVQLGKKNPGQDLNLGFPTGATINKPFFRHKEIGN